MDSMEDTGERAVSGVTSGLLGANQEVTWHARHLGIWQHLTSRMTAFEPPRHFRDSMVRGAFKCFDHDHYFERTGPDDAWTRMRDEFSFDSPLGPLGHFANVLFLTRYMRGFLRRRNVHLREVAEDDRWKGYLS